MISTPKTLNEFLERFGYPTEGYPDFPLEKRQVTALLSRVFGAIDVGQVVRCGLSTYVGARSMMSRISSGKNAPLAKLTLPDLPVTAFRADKNCSWYKKLAAASAPFEHLVGNASPVVGRAHDLYCSSVASALTFSDFERFRPLYGRVLVRGCDSVKAMLRLYDDDALFVNALAPDFIAKKRCGAVFFEVDRGTEKAQTVGRKFLDYAEVLQNVSAEEMSETVVFVSAFNSRKERTEVYVRGCTTVNNAVATVFGDLCEMACSSLRRRTEGVFTREEFLSCALKGLRFMIAPGLDSWIPDKIDEILAKESGRLSFMLSPALRVCGRIGEYPVGSLTRKADVDTITFPCVVLPTSDVGTNSSAIIYENISADPCGRERAVRLLSSRDFIRPRAGENAFLVMEIESEKDAEQLLMEVARRDAVKYPATDFQFSYLLSGGLYRAFRIVANGDKMPTYDNIGHGFIFRTRDRYYLPKSDEVFTSTYRKGIETVAKTASF